MLDLTGQYDAIFLYIANYINIRTYDCDRVCYVIGTTIFTQEREDDGTVHVPGEGDISWDSFVSRYVCIPAEFGTKCLCMDERWRPLVQQCIREIPQFLDKHISITDYFSKE